MRKVISAVLLGAAALGAASCSRAGDTSTASETILLNDEGVADDPIGDPGANLFNDAGGNVPIAPSDHEVTSNTF